MRELEWPIVMRRDAYNEKELAARDAVADAAKRYDWPALMPLLERRPGLVNAWRPGGPAWFTPLHQAAHGGAPAEVVERMIALGAWRSLPNADGDRAVDIARQRGRTALLELLEPPVGYRIDAGALAQIEAHFHEVIRGRISRLAAAADLRLPALGPLTERAGEKLWFPVPGMYGGFHYGFMEGESEPTLFAKSWSRVSEGSGQHHRITPGGAQLVEEGFV